MIGRIPGSLLVIVLLVSCRSPISIHANEGTQPSPNYKLVISDRPGEERFDLELFSNDDRAFCIEIEQWPKNDGKVDGGGETANLITPSRRIPASDSATYSCPGGCGYHKVRSKQSLTGFISYSAFGNAEEIAALPQKNLEFRVWPHYDCD